MPATHLSLVGTLTIVICRTRKGNFLKQIDRLIDRAIAVHYTPVSDAARSLAYSELLFLEIGFGNRGLSYESVEDMASSNLHVIRFLGLTLEDDVRDSFRDIVLPNPADDRGAWDGLFTHVNKQIQALDITVRKGCRVNASITQSPRKPKVQSAYEVVSDREERDDEAEDQSMMRAIEKRPNRA